MINMKTHGGQDIYDACDQAVKLAVQKQEEVRFKFNDIILIATPATTVQPLVKEYNDLSTERHEKWINSDEYKQQEALYQYQKKMKDHELAEALALAPAHMTLRDPDGWMKCRVANPDGYGAAINSYAERWARLMEAGMARGYKLADIADRFSHLADNDGLTGFMYGCAVSILAQVWIHGEELRRWHNLNTQLKDEGEKANESGGVLNPAVLCIGK